MLQSFIVKWGVVPGVITNPGGFPKEALIQTSGIAGIFTSLFIHIGWVHLIGNMLYLFIFGDNVEDILGHGKYLLFYLASGVFASVAHAIVSITITGSYSWGKRCSSRSSWSILYQFPAFQSSCINSHRVFLPVVEVPSILFLFLWFFTNLLSGVASLGVQAQGGVAWWAHVGGFVVGMLLSILWRRRHLRQ